MRQQTEQRSCRWRWRVTGDEWLVTAEDHEKKKHETQTRHE
jgi:hypothetical protein